MLLSCKKAADGVADAGGREGPAPANELAATERDGRLTAILLLVSCEGSPCTTDTGRVGGTTEVGCSGTADTYCWVAGVEVLLEFAAEGCS